MQITDKVLITRSGMTSVGSEHLHKVLMEYDISELMKELDSNGIKIDPNESEKHIMYKIRDDTRESTVPFNSSFGKETDVIGYTLRNEKMEIEIRNYYKSEGPVEMIGGSYYTEEGIQCSLKFEGTYEEAKQVETAKKVLIEFYRDDEYLDNDPIARSIKEYLGDINDSSDS